LNPMSRPASTSAGYSDGSGVVLCHAPGGLLCYSQGQSHAGWRSVCSVRNFADQTAQRGRHSDQKVDNAMANILNLDRRARLLLVCLKEFRSTPNRCGCRRPLPGGHARTDRFPGKGVTNPLGRLLIDYFLRTQFSTTTKNRVRGLPHVYTNLNGCFPAGACADYGCSQLPVYANQNGLERMHPLQFRIAFSLIGRIGQFSMSSIRAVDSAWAQSLVPKTCLELP
jgi:hypothetical protein